MKKTLLNFIFLSVIIVNIIAEQCNHDNDCYGNNVCDLDKHICQSKYLRISRGIEACLHDGQCPSRYRCIVFFCVYVGPDDIPQRNDTKIEQKITPKSNKLSKLNETN